MHETLIYFESTSGLFIVHFDYSGGRTTQRYRASDKWDMEAMGQDVAEWDALDWAAI